MCGSHHAAWRRRCRRCGSASEDLTSFHPAATHHPTQWWHNCVSFNKTIAQNRWGLLHKDIEWWRGSSCYTHLYNLPTRAQVRWYRKSCKAEWRKSSQVLSIHELLQGRLCCMAFWEKEKSVQSLYPGKMWLIWMITEHIQARGFLSVDVFSRNIK